MDGSRFDEAVMAFTRAFSRRHVLSGAALALGIPPFELTGAKNKKKQAKKRRRSRDQAKARRERKRSRVAGEKACKASGVSCARNTDCCDGFCQNFEGQCVKKKKKGKKTNRILTGNCRCTATPVTCPSGATKCGEQCVYLYNDAQNCAVCNSQCIYVSPNMECQTYSCRCKDGFAFCGGTCTDRLSDRNHCGQCGNQCASDQTCNGGQCVGGNACTGVADYTSCGTNHYCVRGTCIDFAFPGTLEFPWCAGDREPRRLTQDWDGHVAHGIALDFGKPGDGTSVAGSFVLAPMSGTVTPNPTSIETLGKHVQIDAGNGWAVILAHLIMIDDDLGATVLEGDVVGTLGNSGLPQNPPHIHIDLFIWVNGQRVTPNIDRINELYGHPRASFACTGGCGTREFTSDNTSERCTQTGCVGEWFCGEDIPICGADQDGECVCDKTPDGFAVCDKGGPRVCPENGQCSGCPAGYTCVKNGCCDNAAQIDCYPLCGAPTPEVARSAGSGGRRGR